MTDAPATFTIGLEEEYLLVDRESRDLVVDPPKGLMADCKARLGSRVSPEFFRCQIEIATRIASTLGEARDEIRHLRGTIAAAAADYGLAPIAAGTHPFSDWSLQRNTDKERYRQVAHDLQLAGRRLVTCGLHVHVAIEDERERFGTLFPPPLSGALHVVAVLARRSDGIALVSRLDPARGSTERAAAGVRPSRGLPPRRQPSDQRRADHRRDQDLVGSEALGALSDPGAQDPGRVYPHR